QLRWGLHIWLPTQGRVPTKNRGGRILRTESLGALSGPWQRLRMGGGLLEFQLRGRAVRWFGLAHRELCAARDARWVLAVCAVAPAISGARHRRHSGRLSHCKHADCQAFCAIVVFQQFGARSKTIGAGSWSASHAVTT